ncbi:MAG: tetratricopeptide repeat protein, partial [Myxococcales bacterium]|nr:tetratricopeptide repeat protein [Myxococcales bacterium]
DRSLLLSLVNAWSGAGAHERAIRAIDVALAAAPADEEALLHMRAVLHIASGDLEPALVDLERAFMLSGGSYAEELATLLEQIVATGTGDVATHRVRLAEILVNLEQTDEACVHLQAVVAADPENREALTTLAALHADAGRADASIDCYSALLALLDGEPLVDATLAFADLCDAHDRLATLKPALERATRIAPARAELKQRLRSTYAALGENRALASILLDDAEAETDPSQRFVLLTEAARILVDPKNGDPARAMTVLAEARQIKADDPETTTLLADALAASGKSGEALEMLEQLLVGQKRRSKSRSAIHRRVAHLYLGMGAKSTALQSLVKAMEDDPHDAELAMAVGDMAVEQNDFDAMPRAFRTVTLMKTAPAGSGARPTPEDKAVAYYQLARVAHLQGDPKKARLLADKSLSEAPTSEARALRDALKT